VLRVPIQVPKVPIQVPKVPIQVPRVPIQVPVGASSTPNASEKWVSQLGSTLFPGAHRCPGARRS